MTADRREDPRDEKSQRLDRAVACATPLSARRASGQTHPDEDWHDNVPQNRATPIQCCPHLIVFAAEEQSPTLVYPSTKQADGVLRHHSSPSAAPLCCVLSCLFPCASLLSSIAVSRVESQSIFPAAERDENFPVPCRIRAMNSLKGKCKFPLRSNREFDL